MMQRKIIGVGVATFFFGFGAGAALNLYLLSIHDPLVTTLRASLTYRSAILGDGLLLPIINMLAVYFILQNKKSISHNLKISGLFLGFMITLYFHLDQAIKGLVNWAMPTPWHWNFLGLWHAIYMFSVASLLSLFYLVALKLSHQQGTKMTILAVTLGMILFFILLGTDYY